MSYLNITLISLAKTDFQKKKKLNCKLSLFLFTTGDLVALVNLMGQAGQSCYLDLNVTKKINKGFVKYISCEDFLNIFFG